MRSSLWRSRLEREASLMVTERSAVTVTRVGYVVRSWPRLSQTFILQEIAALERRGVEVEVFSLSRSHEPLVQPEIDGLRAPVRHLDPPSTLLGRLICALRLTSMAATHPVVVARVLFARSWDRGYHGASRFVLLRQASQLAARVRAGRRSGRRLQHLHAHFAHDPAGVASIVSGVTGIPFSFTAHARDLYQLEPGVLAARVAAAAAVVTICDANLEHIRSICRPHDRPRVTVVHNGLDLADFDPAGRADTDGSLRIVSIARLVEKKGLDDLVAVCMGLRARGIRFTCRIFGEGPLQRALQESIERGGLGALVTLEGARTRAELVAILVESDVFALLPFVTADGDRDGIPTVLVEAMAMGLPVVTTAVAGIPDLVHDGVDGIVLRPRDVASATSAIALLAREPSERARLGEAARKTVEASFDGAQSARQLAAIFCGQAEPVDDDALVEVPS